MNAISQRRSTLLSGICFYLLFSLNTSAQRMIRSTSANWLNSAWENSFLSEFTYDSAGNQDSTYSYGWVNNAWQIGSVHTCTYSSGLLTELMTRNWNTSSSAWDPYFYSTCSYTTGNMFWQQVFYQWNGSAWVNGGKSENTYDQNSHVIQNNSYLWKYNAYQNNVQATYSNNAAGNATFTMMHHWDTLSSTWVNNSRVYTTYTGTNVTTNYQEIYYQNAWHPHGMDIQKYNTNNQLDTGLYKQYYSNAWNNIALYTYTHAPIGDYTVVTHMWDQAASTWTTYSRMIVEFELQQQPTSLPGVLTLNLSGIGINSVACSGDVTNDGGTTVTARGFVYSTSANPTLSNSSLVTGSGLGTFSGTLTGLSPGTLYYVRAFATNSVGTIYGTTKLFTTASLPTGIEEITSTEFNLFPSPATNVVTITGVSDNSIVQLFDLKGTLLVTKTSAGNVTTIDLSTFPPGCYLVRTNEGMKRVVKE